MDGAFLTLTTQFASGTRYSTAHAHLSQARRRPNLQVLTNTLAEAVTFEGQTPHGRNCRPCRTTRAHQGSSGSDRMCQRHQFTCTVDALRRRAIGRTARLGIDVVADRASVGDQLQEHAAVPINKFVNVPTYNSETGPLHMAKHVLQYYLFKKGPMVTPAVRAMATARTRPDLSEPDVQLHFPAAELRHRTEQHLRIFQVRWTSDRPS